jgi:hypothetical protein
MHLPRRSDIIASQFPPALTEEQKRVIEEVLPVDVAEYE